MIKTILRGLTIPGIFNLLLLTSAPGLASMTPAPGPTRVQQNVPNLASPPRSNPGSPSPQDLPPPEQPQGAKDTLCLQRVQVHNRAGRDLKFIYAWVGPESAVYTIKKNGTAELTPVHCVSRLSVVTHGKTSSMEVKPGQDYDLIWSAKKKAFIFKETVPKSDDQKKAAAKGRPGAVSPP